jgi:O-acetyl-ADP-ribose deacetylase (regulator of RNase III)
MGIEIIQGNIFTTKCKVIVNTVNCVGVMGAGIALECRLRYPEMFKKYYELCESKKIEIGKLWLYRSTEKWILNFPTKIHWKFASKPEFLHNGLKKFVSSYKEKEITSIAFPLLGADKGAIPPEISLDIMQHYLRNIPIDIEIYKYDPKAKDDIYDGMKELLFSLSIDDISRRSGLGINYINKILNAMHSEHITQLNQLARVNGVGIKSLEKIFKLSRETRRQLSLF